jgi:hypothetical protein
MWWWPCARSTSMQNHPGWFLGFFFHPFPIVFLHISSINIFFERGDRLRSNGFYPVKNLEIEGPLYGTLLQSLVNPPGEGELGRRKGPISDGLDLHYVEAIHGPGLIQYNWFKCLCWKACPWFFLSINDNQCFHFYIIANLTTPN